ncbi:unnamed protein product [Rhizopus microsporus]|uniref:Uncharacterized protein n=1 Tax=Rhizopus microsporus TaxID=58291 RepID=A0A0A1N9K5_RHIZD|nr:hypothetical protein BCV71DRAFT_265459 [Rhizopus microsporus]CEI93540.1 hypothetical protein RMCBS344292_07772 [Rhizopus microsporus]
MFPHSHSSLVNIHFNKPDVEETAVCLALTEQNLTLFNQQFPPYKEFRKENTLLFVKEQEPIIEQERLLKEQQRIQSSFSIQSDPTILVSEKVIVTEKHQTTAKRLFKFSWPFKSHIPSQNKVKRQRRWACIPFDRLSSLLSTAKQDDFATFAYPLSSAQAAI